MAVTAAPAKPEETPKPWTMPPCCIGEVVLHYLDRTHPDPVAAIVTKVGAQTLSLHVFPDMLPAWSFRDGVRHRDDPFLREPGRQTSEGCWDYTEVGKLTRRLLKEMSS